MREPTCIRRTEIERWLFEQTAGVGAGSITAHLESCRSCRELVAGHELETELLVSAVNRSPTPALEEEEWQQILDGAIVRSQLDTTPAQHAGHPEEGGYRWGFGVLSAAIAACAVVALLFGELGGGRIAPPRGKTSRLATTPTGAGTAGRPHHALTALQSKRACASVDAGVADPAPSQQTISRAPAPGKAAPQVGRPRAASPAVDRIQTEFQTDDPKIRIVWVASRRFRL